MNTPRYAAAAAKLLSRHLPVAAGTPGDSARGVATIERAMRARTRRRRLFGLGGVLSAAAALALLVHFVGQARSVDHAPATVAIDVSPSGNGAALSRGATEQPLAAHAALQSGQRIETPLGGGASLQLSTGTSMDLAGRTSFQVDNQGLVQRFSLQRGELSAHVAKLNREQRFIVETPDAEVEVRGTRFHLRVVDEPQSCGAGTRTRLEVTEGVVEVRTSGIGAVRVTAGQSWPTDCGGEPEPSAAPVTAVPTLAPVSIPKREPALTAANTSEPASALAPQNDLFAEGVARRRQGDTSGALRAYQDLIYRFPRSPLAENAMVERMRLLSGAEARAEAKRYLAGYPRGFALKEAQKLATPP